MTQGSLRGVLTLVLPNGLIIHNCQLLEVGTRRWVGLPALRFQMADGSVQYRPMLEFKTQRAHRKFRQAAQDAVDHFLRLRGEL